MGTDGISVELTVTNSGARAGSDLVQLYVRSLERGIDRPDKELRAFGKIRLAPDQSGNVRLSISPRDFSYFDIDAKAFVARAGRYELVIASNATEVHRTITITLAKDYVEPGGGQ
jgi:beta-glucosidase